MKAILAQTEGDLSTPLLGLKSEQDLNNCQEALMSSTDDEQSYGCTHSHLPKKFRIRAPCCNQIFACIRCHDESKNNLGHKIPRKQIRQVICSLCNTEHEFQQICINYGACMGRYFCGICKVLKDDTLNKTRHCLGCGRCRQGRLDDEIFHCNKCQCCLEKTHTCIEGMLHRNCPIYFEYLFEMTGAVSAMSCGHVIHNRCYPELEKSPNTCPICFKTRRNATWKLHLHQFLNIFKTNW